MGTVSPFTFVFAELRRFGWPWLLYCLAFGLLLGVTIHGVVATRFGIWWGLGQILLGLVAATLFTPLLALACQRWALWQLGVRKMDLVFGEDASVMNNRVRDFVFTRPEMLLVVGYGNLPMLVWIAGLFAFPDLRPGLGTVALVQLTTNVADTAIVSFLLRNRHFMVFIYDDPESDATCFVRPLASEEERPLPPA